MCRWWSVSWAKIPKDLRNRFELYGETLMAFAILSGDGNRIGKELADLGQNHREEIVDWLRERRDLAKRRDNRLEVVEWALLVFAILGVVIEAKHLLHGGG